MFVQGFKCGSTFNENKQASTYTGDVPFLT